MKPLVAFRDPCADDLSFIFASWLKSYRNSDPCTHMLNEVYYGNHKKVVERLLKESQVIMVCNADEPDHIFGYAVYDYIGTMPLLHYIYVKQPYRRFGIAHQLYLHVTKGDETAPVMTTHASHVFRALKDKWRLIYNPYLVDRIAG